MNKFYITTAIDYTNDKPHIGHALEKIQADTIARYHRLKGDDVFFLTGTDEHGAKIAHSAKASGKEPQEFVDDIAGKFKALHESLNLSIKDFIRTTDRERHWPGAILMWQKLMEAGVLYKKKYRGLYCVGHEAFITEKELVGGKCPDHQKEPEVIEEENWFFKLSTYRSGIKEKIEKGEFKIMPATRQNEILAFLEHAEDVSFSRSKEKLSWGIPVPGDETQTMYVWCDALTNYVSAIGYGRNEEYKKWWNAENEIAQVIGKDILRFHAAIWPAMLLAAKLSLPKKLFVHGFITVDGKKMSKTVGNVIDPEELVKKYGTDAVRYFFLREIPTGEDGDFSEDKFMERYNADLVNGLGNLVARVLQMSGQYLDKPISMPNPQGIFESSSGKLMQKHLDVFELDRALFVLWSRIKDLDILIDEQKPFDVVKTDKPAAEKQLIYLLTNLAEIAMLLQPFMPDTSKKIVEAITKNKKPENLFVRLVKS